MKSAPLRCAEVSTCHRRLLPNGWSFSTAILALIAGIFVDLEPLRAADSILRHLSGSSTDAGRPSGSLTLSGNKFYGMSESGGTNGAGTVFTMNTDGTGFGVLYNGKSDSTGAALPKGSLTLSGSTLYGMSPLGGSGSSGTVFKVGTDGSGFALLHSFVFSDGAAPFGALTLSGSTLFGMTQLGGDTSDGTIFKVNTDGTGFMVLRSFAGATDGNIAIGSMVLSGSKLYGMTLNRGPGGSGTVFGMNTDGTSFAVLHGFAGGTTDGSNPNGSLTLSGSTLYGTTALGGTADSGTVFKVGTNGTGFSLLHSFLDGPTDGGSPGGSLTLSGSTLYGTTERGGASDSGTAFRLQLDGSGYGLLHSFTGSPTDGAYPVGDLTLSGDGTLLYGMTPRGGANDEGVIFAIAVPEPGSAAFVLLGGLLLASRRGRA